MKRMFQTAPICQKRMFARIVAKAERVAEPGA